MVAGTVDTRRVVTSEPSHMTSGPTSAELHPVYPSPHAANPSAAAIGIPVSEPQTAFRPVAKRLFVTVHPFVFVVGFNDFSSPRLRAVKLTVKKSTGYTEQIRCMGAHPV